MSLDLRFGGYWYDMMCDVEAEKESQNVRRGVNPARLK